MDGVVTTRIDGGVLLVTVHNPPVNALNNEVRRGLEAAFREAAHPDVRAVLLLGAGKHFIAGADIREFGEVPQEPRLAEVCNRIEACSKPVVAALHGSVLGGGLEVALAAHCRVATIDARLGFPEVRLGLLPGAGGTQRLPRLIGVRAALELMLSGKPISASAAARLGLVDRILATDGFEAQALACARDLAALAERPAMAREMLVKEDIAVARQLIAEARTAQAKTAAAFFAPHRIVDAVEGAVEMPFDEGLQLEHRLFTACKESPQCKNLVHLFFAERAVAKVPKLSGVAPRAVEEVGIVGGGTMGAGIAAACLNAGLRVVMVERDNENCAQGRQRVEGILSGWLAKHRIDSAAHKRLLGAFTTTVDYAALGVADFVIEAVFEDLSVKRAVFRNLDKHCKPGAILASNTSYLDVNKIATETTRGGDVVGMHFFSPAHVMKLVEVVDADASSKEAVATAFALAKRLGKIAVCAKVSDGFIGNRILRAYRQVAYRLVEDGATPYAIDAAIRHFGYPIGPFQMFDMAGGDIGWAMRKRRATMRDPRDRYVRIPDLLCERGWFGQKSGRGWYRYPAGSRAGEEDSDVIALIEGERSRRGVVPRGISADEIVERYFTAMINAGADVVNDGVALRPLDVDVVLTSGYGFPRHRGGPMAYADSIGLAVVLANIERFAQQDPRFWVPSPLIEKLVSEKRTFESMNDL